MKVFKLEMTRSYLHEILNWLRFVLQVSVCLAVLIHKLLIRLSTRCSSNTSLTTTTLTTSTQQANITANINSQDTPPGSWLVPDPHPHWLTAPSTNWHQFWISELLGPQPPGSAHQRQWTGMQTGPDTAVLLTWRLRKDVNWTETLQVYWICNYKKMHQQHLPQLQ